MVDNMEVIVGTYEQVLVGFDVVYGEDELEYRLKPKFAEKEHAGCIKCAANSGQFLATGSSDETIRLYNLKDHRELGALMQHEGTITCLAFHNNTHMLSASEDRTICVWECRTWECLKTLKGHRGHVNSISVHPSGRLALSVSKDKTLRTWNLVTGKSAYVTNIKEVAFLVKWSPVGDSYALAIGTKIVVYKLATAALSFTMEFSRYVLALEFLSENILAAGGEFEGIRILDIEKEQCLQTVKGHARRVKDLCMTEDLLKEDDRRLLLFSTSSDGDLRGWAFNPENFEEEPKLVARYEVPGRPTCLTVVGRRTPPVKVETAVEAMAVEPGELGKEKKKTGKGKGKADRRTTSTSADEPKKKKNRTKKKKSAKKRTSSGQKTTAEGKGDTAEKMTDDTGTMEGNESGESNDNNNDSGEEDE
ncbi:p21-activated protein kinase-interacting protein 1-like protein [Desmophyllum pertusum]|uniref:P21-activated protein kinase-interacting protein 1-like protein n=1 Tax=Desmophyllum pertusum TaxID=174260 RepID=A0A9W9ZNS6_9CNID|nr:p21-activated protein kinase-interacting protein 1-like protein [Desmophyllum pertusum]